MQCLLYFIFGIVFIIVVYPFLQCLANLIRYTCEYFLNKLTFYASEYAVKVEKMKSDLEEVHTNVIGFAMPDEDDFDDEDDDIEERL